MPRPIDPAKRYRSDEPCPRDNTYERFVNDNHCCECRKKYMREYAQRFKKPRREESSGR